jgi:A118 family predicted phage portal protein
MRIAENMAWPPIDFLGWKMAEHSAWYTGDPEILADYYSKVMDANIQKLPYPIRTSESFWGRQYKNQGEIFVHVPIAGDIAETSANVLFGDSPVITIGEDDGKKASQASQKELDKMLLESKFFNKIMEAAETCAAIGGAFIKVAWDSELSEYPIPVVMQADKAIPTFRFCILTKVVFWQVFEHEFDSTKFYRLLETYERGKITNELFLGSADKLGMKVELTSCEYTNELEDIVVTPDTMLAVYIPNVLPNRLNRNSYLGRSDYSGIEGMMDSLDEIYSNWVKDIVLAQGKIHIPEAFLSKVDGKRSFNVDKMLYVKLDMDPTIENKPITATQFDVRAEQFEKSALNFLERIVTSAGYSPQSFGLNISGGGESGVALNVRERKSFATKAKKEQYWQPALKQLIEGMIAVYSEMLGGSLPMDEEVNITFGTGASSTLTEIATAVKMISDAQAASTETKVRWLHDDWDEEQVKVEVAAILSETAAAIAPPEGNPDQAQMDTQNNKSTTETDTEDDTTLD